ncbi:hypothetical protein AK830_g175 [Neonectria ditissima]|uniref:FAD-binding domain-containing protein n=1 Tax=Neonectria ditissima TaxID=78410 RepID=A0A0P7BMG0_9HYPO|nr:hypothetical protein AK830_g175 [Neonectria ditissima]
MSPFKVAIVGGSLAGLTIAHLLEKLDIDFILLEAYDQIAPQLGASIGWHPNGLRILDQLGCYEDIRAAAASVDLFTSRTEDGRVLYSHRIGESVLKRHGYEVLFMERRVALEILFKNLKRKESVLTGQRIVRVEQDDGKVRLFTKEGREFEADVVIGADGVHSTLRREIWRMSEKMDSSFVSEKESQAVKTEYGCIFGMSKPTGDLKTSEAHLTHKKGITIACIVGPKNIPYWFLFFKLPQVHTGVDLPRYSQEFELGLAKQEAETCINASVKFKQLYANKTFTTTTPLPHHVFSRWHLGRVMLIGDSAHKFNPISGEGGNGALESAAALVDHLHQALHENKGKLSTAQIQAVFAETASIRQPRVSTLVEGSIKAQRLMAWSNGLYRFVDCQVLPLISTDMFVNGMSSDMVNAYKSHALSCPPKARTVPFIDELPAKRKTGWWYKLPTIGAYGLLWCAAVWGIAIAPGKYGSLDALDAVVRMGKFPGHEAVMKNFDHVPILGSSMSFLIAVYFPAAEGWDIGLLLLTFYLSISELVVFASWTVESHRVRNRASLARGAVVFGSISNVTAIAFGACVYYFADNITNAEPDKWWMASTFVPPNQAAAVLPATLLGMLAPTLLMFNIWFSSAVRQNFTILWMFCPLYLYFAHRYFARKYSKGLSQNDDPRNRAESIIQLRRLYNTLAFVTGATHITTVLYAVLSPNPSVSLQAVFSFRYSQGMSVYEGNHMMFLWDFYVTVFSLLVWSVLSIWAMSRAGVAKVNMAKVVAAAFVGTAVIGPAATASLLCGWRETKQAEIIKA